MGVERLLETIIAEPANIDARLVYADALMETGDPRGDFIALQVQDDERADELLKRHRREWTDFLRPTVTGRGCRFRNGFVERITMKPQFLEDLPRIMDETPLLDVRFRDLKSDTAKLARMATCTSRLRWLDLKQSHVTGRGFAELMQGQWQNLIHLRLRSIRIGAIGMDALLDAELQQLLHLDLYGARIRDDEAWALTKWPRLEWLESLNLRSNELSDEVLAALVRGAKRCRSIGLPDFGPLTEAALRRSDSLESITDSRAMEYSWQDDIDDDFEPYETYAPSRDPFDVPWP